jgi:hypothetical protein
MKSKMTLKEVFAYKPKAKALKTSSSLRNVILKEIRSVLREDASPDKVDAERFPLPLSSVASDVEKAKELVQSGDDEVDEGSADDVIGVGGGSFSVGDLKPSQSSMNIQKALSMALGMIRDDKAGGDLGAFISSDKHIMDGHHRWIATAMVDPTAQIGGFGVDFPADKLIPVLNALTVGRFGVTAGKPATGGFDQFKEGPIRDQLEAYLQSGAYQMEPEAVQRAIEKFTEEKGEAAIDAAVEKFVKNLGAVSFDLPSGAPSREDMPVIDEPDVPDAIAALSGGEVDVNPPYGWEEGEPLPEEEADDAMIADSHSRDEKVVLERWRRLAGLLTS